MAILDGAQLANRVFTLEMQLVAGENESR